MWTTRNAMAVLVVILALIAIWSLVSWMMAGVIVLAMIAAIQALWWVLWMFLFGWLPW